MIITVKRQPIIMLLLCISIIPVACVPKPTIDGENIQIKAPLETLKCQHLGNTRITLQKSNLLLLTKNKEKIAQTLLVDARNLATRIGADTVVADKVFPDNSQAFRFYICTPFTSRPASDNNL